MAKAEVEVFNGTKYLRFRCVGCKRYHEVTVEGQHQIGPVWGWNGSVEAVTLSPSILVKWHVPLNLDNPEFLQKDFEERKRQRATENPRVERICHSFVRDGNIQYLNDCWHQYKGQTVELPEWTSAKEILNEEDQGV